MGKYRRLMMAMLLCFLISMTGVSGGMAAPEGQLVIALPDFGNQAAIPGTLSTPVSTGLSRL
ncbi:hypothetical protein, partial [Candidatus Entotheonella palauensis]|uniref:hypothetical protein n=1 Tax=Candidatus Entotheonella palauensis TaxID=93172 RepID=UPI001C4E09A1